MTKRPSSKHGDGHGKGGPDPSIERWVYVLPIAPATSPPDLYPGGGPDPLSPSFVNGWGNVAGEQPVSFERTLRSHIKLRGAITGGTIPSVVFTLPANFRPVQGPVALTFPAGDGASVYTGKVDTNGDVSILGQLS